MITNTWIQDLISYLIISRFHYVLKQVPNSDSVFYFAFQKTPQNKMLCETTYVYMYFQALKKFGTQFSVTLFKAVFYIIAAFQRHMKLKT